MERLVGLIVRLILAPTEEYAAIYFSAQIPRNTTSNDNGQVPRQAIMTFLSIVRYISTFGAILLTFCVPYSRLIVWIYGGELLVENDGLYI